MVLRGVPTPALRASLVFIFLTVASTQRYSADALFAIRQPQLRSIKQPQCVHPHQTLKSSNGFRNRRQSVRLNYADEWVDADVNLAFNTGGGGSVTATSKSNKSHKHNGVGRRFFTKISRVLYLFKEAVRMKLEKCTVYVLECEDGKYYVGSTQNRKRRFKQHERGRGSQWTRLYKPIRVLREHKRIPSRFLLGLESKVTAECMLEFGVNNVRGSYFCSPRDYHVGDVEALTKFLGHYCDLNYRKVNARLSQTLPATPGKRYRRKSTIPARCYCCGKLGHKASMCPERAPESK